MEFIIIIGGVVILVLILNLRSRVQKLEQLIQTKTPERAPELNYQTQPKQLETQQPLAAAPTQITPTSFDKFVEWLKEDWLLKLGAMLLLIGFGWLTTYAFLNNWIGPMGRIALGIIAGSLFILLG